MTMVTDKDLGIAFRKVDLYEISTAGMLKPVDKWLYNVHAALIRHGLLEQNYYTLLPIEMFNEFAKSEAGRNLYMNMLPKEDVDATIFSGTMNTSPLRYMGFTIMYSNVLEDSIIVIEKEMFKNWLELTQRMVNINTKRVELKLNQEIWRRDGMVSDLATELAELKEHNSTCKLCNGDVHCQACEDKCTGG